VDWGWGVQWALWAQWEEICTTIITLTRTPILRTRTPTPMVIPMGLMAIRSLARRRTPAEVRLNHRLHITNTYLRGLLRYSCIGKCLPPPLLSFLFLGIIRKFFSIEELAYCLFNELISVTLVRTRLRDVPSIESERLKEELFDLFLLLAT